MDLENIGDDFRYSLETEEDVVVLYTQEVKSIHKWWDE